MTIKDPNEPRESAYVGEMCPKCKKARMLHPRLYVYTCPFCRFSYQINPVGRFDDITILNKGESK